MTTASVAARKSHRWRKPTAPAFAPSQPSDEYLELSQISSIPLSTPSDGEQLPRKLLVLDLNGTLVLRAPRAWGSYRPVLPRPYAKTFREYVFHQGSQLDVMVWSSAQPHSVDSMVEVFFDSDRSELVGLWARDTLGLTEEQYAQKVQTVKNLNIVWDAPVGLPPPIKVAPPPPMAVLTTDPTTLPGYDPSKPAPPFKTKLHSSTQLMISPSKSQSSNEENQDRSAYWSVPEVRPEDPIPGLDGNGEALAAMQEPSGIYSALNTLLLDDSPLKAHLQPYNNLTLPEYTADLRARDVKRKNALEELTRDEGQNVEESGKPKPHFPKPLRAAPFDKTLIAVIGVLHAVRHESSIVGWMCAGGMRPNAKEISRVAGLFEEEPQGQEAPEEVEEGIGETVGEIEERSPLKRSSDDMDEDDRGSPKRHRSELALTAAAGVNVEGFAAEEMQIDAPTNIIPPVDEPLPLQNVNHSQFLSESTKAMLDTTSSTTLPSTTFLATETSIPVQPSRKKRNRRLKNFFPVTHPLSAEDSYPFFTSPNEPEKLWFQDREIYTYWVRRGLLALRECGIEPNAGVEDN